jgi:RNA polymerase subunit RPABC4/transcription elongation factor Spt4
MDQIFQTIGDSIGGIFDSAPVQFGLRAIGIYLIIIWLASAYWAFRDMQQRSDNAILPYIAAAGIILFTPIFAEVEAIHHCPSCEKRIDDEWIICPNCRTRLKRVCPNCSRLVGMDWSLCAWCGKDFERREVPAAAAMESLPRGRDATGRYAIPATSTEAETDTAAAAATPTPLPSSLRSTTPKATRSGGASIPAAAQDPLPER